MSRKLMTRREFIGNLPIAILLTVWIVGSVLKDLAKWQWKRLLGEDTREELIARALSTRAGRKALAETMVMPIRRSLEYQAVGRKLLMVDELPQGALPRYERNRLQYVA